MSGIDDSEGPMLADSFVPTQRYAEAVERKASTTTPTPPTPHKTSPSWTPKKILTKNTIELPDRLNAKLESHSLPPPRVHPDSDAWLKGDNHGSKMLLPKYSTNEYASDFSKHDGTSVIFGVDSHGLTES